MERKRKNGAGRLIKKVGAANVNERRPFVVRISRICRKWWADETIVWQPMSFKSMGDQFVNCASASISSQFEKIWQHFLGYPFL